MYRVNEIFYSLQGEGMHAGTAHVFLRFSGCNLRCRRHNRGFDCDTQHLPHSLYELPDLIAAVQQADVGACRKIVLTGGEPMMQADRDLCNALVHEGFYVCMETNGTIDANHLPIDWLTVSPKPFADLRQKYASEVKYVVSAGQEPPKRIVDSPHHLLSPAFSGTTVDRDALRWCIDICLRDPTWRLSVQQHKGWRIP